MHEPTALNRVCVCVDVWMYVMCEYALGRRTLYSAKYCNFLLKLVATRTHTHAERRRLGDESLHTRLNSHDHTIWAFV